MLHAYIDESGDEGISDKSSEWLCLGCVLVYEREIDGAKNYLSNGVTSVWKNRTPPAHVHFNKIETHQQKKALLMMLKGLDFKLSVVAAKKSLFSPETLMGLKAPHMYNYVAKHMLERISWYGRDRGMAVRVTFAARSEASWEDFAEYVQLLTTRDDHQIDFKYIASIRNSPSKSNVLLQAADWATSGITCGLNCDSFGNVETGYCEILWGKFWTRKGRFWSYGVKTIPATLVRSDFELFRKIGTWLEDPTAV